MSKISLNEEKMKRHSFVKRLGLMGAAAEMPAGVQGLIVAENSDPFEQVIYTCSRADAVAEGLQMDITRTAQKAGIHFPVFLTRAAFDACVARPEGAAGQGEDERLWNIVWALRFAIRSAAARGQIYFSFVIHVRNENFHPKPVKLVASCGALDLDFSQTAITITMPDDD
jgi:hypothetical protein